MISITKKQEALCDTLLQEWASIYGPAYRSNCGDRLPTSQQESEI
jgi:hypothetical protein